MTEEWVLFQDMQGLWQWTRYDSSHLVVDESQEGFESLEECERDARRHGFVRGADRANLKP